MLTHNLFITTLASFNRTDEWIDVHPNRQQHIKDALKSRKLNHQNYIKKIDDFDVERYWSDIRKYNLFV